MCGYVCVCVCVLMCVCSESLKYRFLSGYLFIFTSPFNLPFYHPSISLSLSPSLPLSPSLSLSLSLFRALSLSLSLCLFLPLSLAPLFSLPLSHSLTLCAGFVFWGVFACIYVCVCS